MQSNSIPLFKHQISSIQGENILLLVPQFIIEDFWLDPIHLEKIKNYYRQYNRPKYSLKMKHVSPGIDVVPVW